MSYLNLVLLLLFPILYGCDKVDDSPSPGKASMYFPSISDDTWETTSLSDLGWNQNEVGSLIDFLGEKNTKSFMILVDGRIVMEAYFDGHTSSTTWQWNSAGKTLVTATIGIAQQDGLLNINQEVSQYLGPGWTNEPLEKESLITSKHLLSMTSGINDTSQLVLISTPN
jgi:hypothetical protein